MDRLALALQSAGSIQLNPSQLELESTGTEAPYLVDLGSACTRTGRSLPFLLCI